MCIDKVIMAEWSKAVDLRPTIFGCAGSNPADSKKNNSSVGPVVKASDC